MEKQQGCDSMTTVTVKDYDTPGIEYPDPPPSYKTSGGRGPALVQVTKIVALTSVVIAGMISFSIVVSAWLSSGNNVGLCQYQQPSIETVLEPQLLRSALLGSNDLDSAESNVNKNKKEGNSKDSSSDEDRESGDDTVTMLKLPLELNLQEQMFERNHRSHMNCVIEKKKAEEIVDEQSKPLPPLLGLNVSTDPRYLHFTGEKMAISCDSGNDHRQAPNNSPPPSLMDLIHDHVQPHLPPLHPMSGSSNIPVQIIGPIPLSSHPSDFHPGMSGPSGPHMIPITVQHSNHLPLSVEETGSIFFSQPPPSNSHPPHFQLPGSFHSNNQQPHIQLPFSQQSSEIRERALPHGIPIMPRHHIQHVIRPRSTSNEIPVKRTKRCACDCACKNHVA